LFPKISKFIPPGKALTGLENLYAPNKRIAVSMNPGMEKRFLKPLPRNIATLIFRKHR